MTRRLRGHQAVYLVTPPPGWKPQRLWDFPPEFTTGQLVARNLRPADAAGYARSHNKAAIEQSQRGEPIATWAIYARQLRPNWRPRKQGQAQGGAA